MIKTQSISAEASASSQSSSGLAQSGLTKGKSKNQSLFSKLLATLQHGTTHKKSEPSAKGVEKSTTETKGTDKTTTEIKGNHKTTAETKDITKTTSTTIAKPTVTGIPQKVSSELTNHTTEIVTTKDIKTFKDINGSEAVAVVQEVQLNLQESNLLKKTGIPETTLQVVKNTTTQTNGETRDNKSSTLLLQNLKPDTVSIQPAQTSLKEQPKETSTIAPVNKKIVASTSSPITPVANQEEAITVTTLNNGSKEKLEQNLSSIKNNLNTKDDAFSAKDSRTSDPLIDGPNNKKSPSLTVIESKVDKPTDDSTKSYIQALQASGVKQQSNHRQPTSQEQPVSALIQTSNLVKGMESSGSSTQQDFTSNQQDINPSLFDNSKTDTKAKGVDFQAQLAYRSQKTFTPANTMLEIVKSAKDGSTSLELQLEPANLGKVQVSIQLDAAKQIQVSFTVDQNASRQALEQHMPQLRQALAQQGLELGSFSMQMNQQNGQQQGSSDQRAAAESELLTSTTLESSLETRIGVNIATDGRLNILA